VKSNGQLAGHDTVAATAPSQPDSSDQSAAVDDPDLHNAVAIAKEVTVASAPQEELEPKPQTSDEQPHGDRAMADGTTATENQEPAVIPEGAQTKTEEWQIIKEQMVVVKTGDSLYRIITSAYGEYDRAKLDILLQQNPEIENPDLIMVGQVIKLAEE
jgi:hypothetical protein